MRVLLLGAGGMLGRDLAAQAPKNVELHSYDRAALEVTDERALAQALDGVRPEVVVNAAAYTAVDRAESEPAEAFSVNAAAVGTLGRLCADRQIAVVHFSTDYVFDGAARQPYRETDPVAPLSVYGRSKLAGERALEEAAPKALIIRTQWLFGFWGASFPRTMWQRALRGEATRVVTDQWGRPTYTSDLARVTWELLGRGAIGVYHVANSGEATWYDVASRVFAIAGVSKLLSACTSAEFPRPATRPRYAVLDTTKLEHELSMIMPHWTSALSEFLARLKASAEQPTPSRI